MISLSVNVNKVATLRNARGGNVPNVLQVALDCERFGADGITVHPRPDERHIRYSDVYVLKSNLTTEFNIEAHRWPLRRLLRPPQAVVLHRHPVRTMVLLIIVKNLILNILKKMYKK